MNKFETLLANVQYPRTGSEARSIEDRIEHVPGVFECSINPSSKNAMIVFDSSKINIDKLEDGMRKEGVSISRILLRR